MTCYSLAETGLWLDLIVARRETAGVVDDDLLLVVEVVPVQLLVLSQLGSVGAEREMGWTPDIPGRSAAHLTSHDMIGALSGIAILMPCST